MASHLEIGQAGEKLAAAWLAENGYAILQRNWRWGKYELDLITEKSGMLRFVEVKYRHSTFGGNPEESVTKKKIQDLMKAIGQYLHLNPQHEDFRLDILSILEIPGKEVEYFLIEDVTPPTP